jgi:lipoyl(octanoyl) transferase
LALNINTHLPDFDLIVPCGLEGVRMTSLQAILGREIPMPEVKQKMTQAFVLEFADYKWLEELRGV